MPGRAYTAGHAAPDGRGISTDASLMPTYTDRALTSDEHVIYRARLSLWTQAGNILLGLLLLPLAGIGLYFLVRVWLTYRTTELAITDKRIIAKRGIFSHTSMELRLDKIESIQVSQPLLGRLLNYGAVTLAGTGGDKTPIESIRDPVAFQKHLTLALDRSR